MERDDFDELMELIGEELQGQDFEYVLEDPDAYAMLVESLLPRLQARGYMRS